MVMPVTNIPIPAILEINKGVINRLETILSTYEFQHIVILFDEFSFNTYEKKIRDASVKINIDTLKMDDNLDIQQLINLSFKLNRYDVVVAMGGGTVIDYGKYIAFSRRCPFISIPTTASNDGFASSNCSLIVEGKKTTVPAKVPFGILADLDIIQHAPDPFILSGTGDLMSNLTALFDWEYEEKKGASRVNAFAHMLSKKAVNSFIRTPMKSIKDPIFLKELISSNTMGGIATVISGNSSPISGSEHLISHALDKISKHPQMHGLQVGIATYLVAQVQNHRAERVKKVFDRTGFFEYVKTLPFDKQEFIEAIKLSPTIKPNRYTLLHEEKHRLKALEILETDERLQQIFQ